MKIKQFTRFALSKFVSFVSIIAIVLASIAPNLAIASSITGGKDTATRLAISTAADHSVSFTLPTGIGMDVTTQTDGLRIDFPASFAITGTFTAAEFTLTDSVGLRTSVTPSQGPGTIDCTVAAGANNFCVAIDTTANVFTIKPSSTWTTSATGSSEVFTIAGSAGNGVLTNPSSVAATNIDIQMCDETANCFTSWVSSHSSQIAYGIADDDQVTISATVNSTITFDLDAKTDFSANASAAPYSVPLGTLSTSTVTHSDTSSIRMIVINGSTNGAGGINITVQNANGTNGLASTSTPADKIPSATATMAAGTANYGLCVDSATLSGFTRAAAYITTCALASGTNGVVALSTTPANIVGTTAPVSAAKAEVVVNAAISGITPAHADYADTLTFIGTGTF